MSRRPSMRPPGEEDPMEKELADDAVWKRIQKNTFTRWVNEHLKTVNRFVMALESDLSDGLVLIALVETLSGKRMPRHNRRPTLLPQKLENINIALNFLQKDEGIKIVNIDGSDLMEGNLKLILGLIWTLILHYSISMPMWEGEDDSMYGQKGGPTPKQRLLGWIRNKIPDVPVNNFTTDWNDGKALGALVDALAPGLCPDWASWAPKDALKNAEEAMKLADDWLDVPQLIKPEDVVNPKVDDLSMMTYLSQYPSSKLKDGAPVKGTVKSNPNRVRVYGPGVQPTGVVVGAITNFMVETFSAGQGKVEVLVLNPNGQPEPCEVKFNDDRSKTYTCTYTAKLEGKHKVVVKFAGVEVPKSPFEVTVEGHAGDSTKVTAKGPGLEPNGVQVAKPTWFEIDTKGAGKGQVEVIILDPQGKPSTVPLRVKPVSEDKFMCEYLAQTVGVHSVNVFFAGKQIPNSPFGVRVSPICDPRKVRASGRGLQPTGVRVGDIGDFKVYTEGAGEGALDIKVIGPSGEAVPVAIKKSGDNVFDCEYKPVKEGKYVVIVGFGGQEIFRSPFEVAVGPFKESKIRAFGPGLKGGIAGYPARFTVDTRGESANLGFTVEGPSQVRIECMDNGDGSADVIYYPSSPGEYAIHVMADGEDIPKSPFMAQILPPTDYLPGKVIAKGPGLEPNGVKLNEETFFTVDTKGAGGHAPVEVIVTECNPVKEFRNLQVKGINNGDGTFKFMYKPETGVKHVVQVNYGGVAVPDSPFRVQPVIPLDPSKIKVFGPGVETVGSPNEATFFNIDCTEAGTAALEVSIKDETGRNVATFQVMDNGDNTFSVDYNVPSVPKFIINLTYGGLPIPGFPLTITSGPAGGVAPSGPVQKPAGSPQKPAPQPQQMRPQAPPPQQQQPRPQVPQQQPVPRQANPPLGQQPVNPMSPPIGQMASMNLQSAQEQARMMQQQMQQQLQQQMAQSMNQAVQQSQSASSVASSASQQAVAQSQAVAQQGVQQKSVQQSQVSQSVSQSVQQQGGVQVVQQAQQQVKQQQFQQVSQSSSSSSSVTQVSKSVSSSSSSSSSQVKESKEVVIQGSQQLQK